MDGGVDVEVNLEIPLEPSVLAAFGLDAEIPTHIPMSVSIQYQNQDQDQERISNRTQDPAAHPSCHDDLLVSDLRTVTSSSSTAFTDSTPTAHTATSYNESLASKLPMSSCDAPGEEVFSAYTMLPPPTEEAGNNVALLHVYRSLFLPTKVKLRVLIAHQ